MLMLGRWMSIRRLYEILRVRQVLRYGGLLCVGIWFVQCHSGSVISRHIQHTQVSYGQRPAQNLGITYLRGDTVGLRPVFFFIHGGGWNTGDKSVLSKDISFYLLSHGILPVSVNYTLAPEEIQINRKEIVYPQNIQDIAQALRWTVDNSKKYGGDSAQIYVVGHSAGAHLAALLVCDTRFIKQYNIDPQVVSGVILLDGGGYLNLNTERFTNIQEISSEADYYKRLHQTYQNAFGPIGSLSYEAANPSRYVRPGNPDAPFLLLHGESLYRSVPNQHFEAKLNAYGIPCQRYEIGGMEHGLFLSTIGTEDTRVSEHVLRFIQTYTY